LTGELHSLGPIAAKLSRPPATGAILRPETIDAFAAGLRRRLTLVCAPAGYGKSTAAAAATLRLGAECVWYKLDLLDRDPVLFLASLTEALRTRAPAFGEPIRERLRAAGTEPFPLAHLQAMFVRECEVHFCAEDLYIVLDDFHDAAESGATTASLDYLLANLPPGLRFVVIGRYDPALRLAKLRLDDQVAFIDTEALRFSPEQAIDVLEARTGVRPEGHLVQQLVDTAEGWPVTIVLAGLVLDWRAPDLIEAALGDPRLKQDIYSYLAEQVYAQEDRATRAFLKRTCCLEHLTVQLAGTVAHTRLAGKRLTHLASNSVFTFSTAEEGSFRYHRLFRDFLRQKYVQDEGEEAFRQLHIETATALEDAGEIELAIELFLDANEPRSALRIVADAGEALLADLPSDRLGAWLERLPPDLRSAEPWPLLMQAQLSCRSGDYGRALGSIEAAERLLAQTADEAGLYEALSMRESALFWRGDTAAAMRACQQALDHATTDAQRIHSLISLGSAAVEARDWTLADDAFARADQLALTSASTERPRAQAIRALALYLRGNPREARELMPETRDLRVSPSLQITATNTLGMIHIALGDYSNALVCLQEALDTARRFGFGATRDMVLDSMGLAMGSAGNLEAGLDYVRTAARGDAYDQQPGLRAWAQCHEATLLRRAGRIEEARRVAERVLSQAGSLDDAYAHLNFRANLLYTQGLLGDDVSVPLDEVAAQAETLRLAFISLKAGLYAAVLETLRGRTRNASERLSAGLPRQLRLGHLHVLAQELCPRPAAALCAVRAVAAQGLVHQLADALALHPAFADLTEEVVAEDADLATVLVDSARRSATDEVLDRVLRAAERAGSGQLEAAVDLARRERPTRSGRAAARLERLTPRELEILALMAAGLRNPDIVARLYLSESTVKTHVNHVFTKLEVTTRVEAVLLYHDALPPG
jgi:LuxR family transcriptional regulator, maltose regulon positive regulatory protein